MVDPPAGLSSLHDGYVRKWSLDSKTIDVGSAGQHPMSRNDRYFVLALASCCSEEAGMPCRVVARAHRPVPAPRWYCPVRHTRGASVRVAGGSVMATPACQARGPTVAWASHDGWPVFLIRGTHSGGAGKPGGLCCAAPAVRLRCYNLIQPLIRVSRQAPKQVRRVVILAPATTTIRIFAE